MTDTKIRSLCSCMTKTPDIEYHKSDCLYRIDLEGYKASVDGKMPDDCPYDFFDTDKYNAWMNGYITHDAMQSGDCD